jgi:4-hydroxy-tetrahydrodipicolinate synthase
MADFIYRWLSALSAYLQTLESIMQELKGICPIIAAPFTNRGDVDYDSLRNLLRVLAAGGCHGLTLFGIAGEYYKLSDAERHEMLTVTVEECKQAGIPSIVSVTQHATEVAVKEARLFQEAGADALMLLPPFFLKPPAEQIFHHIKAVGQAVDIPVVVQYAPEQTGVAIAPAVLQQLGQEVETLAYFKIECKPPGAYITNLYEGTNRQAKIFVGNAGYQMIETFDRGALGVMPGCSMYDVYLKVYDALQKGDREAAYHYHSPILRMLNHIRQNVEMIIAYEKRILFKRGIIASDHCRRPTFQTDKYFDRVFEECYAHLSEFFA